MNDSVMIHENSNSLREVKNEVDIKSEIQIKEDENALFNELYAQVIQSITEANLISLKSIELTQQLSDMRILKDGTVTHFTEVIAPLRSAVDFFTLSLNALQFIGKH